MKIISWISSSFCSYQTEQCLFLNWHFVSFHTLSSYPHHLFSISSPYPVKLYFQIAWQKTHPRAVAAAGPLGPAVTSAPAAKGATCISPAASPEDKPHARISITKINEPYPGRSHRGGRNNVCSWIKGRCGLVELSETEKRECRKNTIIKKKYLE